MVRAPAPIFSAWSTTARLIAHWRERAGRRVRGPYRRVSRELGPGGHTVLSPRPGHPRTFRLVPTTGRAVIQRVGTGNEESWQGDLGPGQGGGQPDGRAVKRVCQTADRDRLRRRLHAVVDLIVTGPGSGGADGWVR